MPKDQSEKVKTILEPLNHVEILADQTRLGRNKEQGLIAVKPMSLSVFYEVRGKKKDK